MSATPEPGEQRHGGGGRLRCSRMVIFGDLGISAELTAGEAVTVDLPPVSPGEHPFTCQLGVLWGTPLAR